MGINYDLHDTDPETPEAVGERFIRSALWNATTEHCAAVREAWGRMTVMMPGSSLNLSMYQNSPSTSRTVYALVLHTGPKADQRRYFRPGAIVAEWEWDVKRGRRLPYQEVIDVCRQIEEIAEDASSR